MRRPKTCNTAETGAGMDDQRRKSRSAGGQEHPNEVNGASSRSRLGIDRRQGGLRYSTRRAAKLLSQPSAVQRKNVPIHPQDLTAMSLLLRWPRPEVIRTNYARQNIPRPRWMCEGRTTMKQQTEAKDTFPRQTPVCACIHVHAGGLCCCWAANNGVHAASRP